MVALTTAPTLPAVSHICCAVRSARSVRDRNACSARCSASCVRGMGVAPPGAVVGKEPPSIWSWSSVRKKTMFGRELGGLGVGGCVYTLADLIPK